MKKSFKPHLIAFVISLLFIFSACEKDKLNGELIRDESLISQLYANASDTIQIDNQDLFLYTELWRNVSPGGPVDTKDRRLMAVIELVNTANSEITKDIVATKLYVINQNKLWKTIPEADPDSNFISRSEYISKDGPNWPTGIYVDVVISVLNIETNQEQFIIARDQYIDKII